MNGAMTKAEKTRLIKIGMLDALATTLENDAHSLAADYLYDDIGEFNEEHERLVHSVADKLIGELRNRAYRLKGKR